MQSESESQGTILIVEDDPAIAGGVALNLRLEGFVAEVLGDGATAVERALELQPKLILLDIELPTKTGLDVLSELRQTGNKTPVIVLSARQDEYDKVAALRLGADDYVTKPFGVAELLARIDAVLRRSQPEAPAGPARSGIVRFSDVLVDLDTREVTRAGERVELTHLEYELLTFLLRNAAKVYTRQELLIEVWGIHHSGSPRTIDNFVGQLRAKLEADPNQPRHIVTVRGTGYRLDP